MMRDLGGAIGTAAIDPAAAGRAGVGEGSNYAGQIARMISTVSMPRDSGAGISCPVSSAA
jgi:hypothetical protein